MAWRDHTCLPLITTHSTVCHHLYQCSSMFLHLHIQKRLHTVAMSVFLSGSSTGSVCGLDCRGAQGGSALTVGGNSFRKYQTARHTHTLTYNPQSFFLLKLLHKLLESQRRSFSSVTELETQRRHQGTRLRRSLIFSGMIARMANPWRYTTQSFGWRPAFFFFMASITANLNESAQFNNKSL